MKNLKVFVLFLLVLAVILAGCTNSGSSSSDYPKSAITWIVPFAAGGAVDLPARTMAPYVEKYLPNDAKFVIVNKPGGAGTIGVTSVFNAKADGYTIGTTAAAALTIRPHFGDTSYKYDEVIPLVKYVDNGQFIVVPWNSPIKTFEDWIDYVQKNPDDFTYGTTGTGNAQHIAMENLASKGKLKIEHVAYGGENEIVAALLGGQLKGAVMNHAFLKSYYEDKKVRPIVNITGVKPDYLKDVPTLKEKDFDVEAQFFHGIVVPKDVPQDIMDALSEAFKKALEDKELIAQFEKMGILISYANAEQFKEIIKNDYNVNNDVLKGMGMIK